MNKTSYNKIFDSLANTIKECIQETFEQNIDSSQISDLFSTPPNINLGQIAFPCFIFAKSLKMGPPIIANKIAEKLRHSNNPYLKKINPTGPYINFELDMLAIGSNVLTEILNKSFFTKKLLINAPGTLIEYSQPNTHKELHVGHMRNLCLGNTLSNLYRYTGHQLFGVTYPGDVGTHVAKCLWYLKKYSPQLPKKDEDKGSWLGALYSTAHNKLESERGTDNEQQNREELTNI